MKTKGLKLTIYTFYFKKLSFVGFIVAILTWSKTPKHLFESKRASYNLG